MLESNKIPTVYVLQEIAGTRYGNPKINIVGAAEYGKIKFLLPELSQIMWSPGPLIFELRKKLRNYTPDDYLLLVIIQDMRALRALSN